MTSEGDAEQIAPTDPSSSETRDGESPADRGRAEARDRRRTMVPGLALVVEWLFLILLFVLPLDPYLTLPGHSSGVFLSQVLLIETCMLAALTILLARLAGSPAPFVVRRGQVLPLGLVVCAGLISLVGAQHRGVGARDVAKYACYFVVFLLACALSGRPNVRMKALISLILGFALVAAFAFIGIAPSLPNLGVVLLNVQQVPAYITNTAHLRAASTFRYSDEFDAYLLLILPMFITLVFKFPERTVGAVKGGVSLLIVVGAVLVVLTYTRTAYVVAAVEIPVLLLLFVGRRTALYATVLAAVALGVAVLVDHELSAKLLSLVAPSASGSASRLTIWQWALQGFPQHPLFGLGPRHLEFQANAPWADQYHGRRETNAESSYLNVLVDIGVVGLATVLATIVGGVRRSVNALRASVEWQDRVWSVGAFCGLLAVLLDATVHPTFYSWQVTGLLCAVVGLAAASPASPGSARHLPAIERDAADVVAESDAEMVGAAWSAGAIPAIPSNRELKSRVVFLVNSAGIGGAQLVTLYLATELQRQGARVLVVCPPTATELIRRLEGSGVPFRTAVMGLSLGRWRGYLGTLAFLLRWSHRRFNNLARQLAAEEPTLFVAPFLREQLLLAKLPDVHSVWVLHSRLHFLPHRLLLRGQYARRARTASAIIALTRHQAAAWHQAGLASSRVFVVPNGIPGGFFEASSQASVEDAERAGRSIGFVSRLRGEKGAQFLLAALPSVLARHPDAQLYIAGAGPYRRRLLRIVRNLGLGQHVNFLGQVEDTPALLGRLGVLVFPSVDPGEVLPTILLEAAAAGIPVVASDLPGIREALVDETTGLLILPGDVKSIAIAVNLLLDDPEFARSMGAEGRKFVASRYALTETATAFRRVLAEVEMLESEPYAGLVTTTGAVRAVHRKRFLGHTGIFLASKLLSALATGTWTVLAAGVLSQTAFGDLMLSMGVLDIGASLTDVGLTTVATRETAQAEEGELRSLIGAQIALRIGLGLVTAFVTIGIVTFLPFSSDAETLARVLAPCLLFSSLSSLSLAFRARGSLWPIVAVSSLTSIAGIALAIATALQGGDAFAFAMVRLITVALSGIATLAMVMLRFRPSLVPRIRAAWRLLISALPYGLSLALVYLYYRIDVPMLALLGGSDEVAVYTSAYRILDVITLLPAAASAIALAEMAKLAKEGDRKRLTHFSQQYLELAFAAGLFMALALNLVGGEILQLLYRGRYDVSLPTFRVLAWAATATLVTNVFLPLMSAMNKRRVLVFANTLGLLVNVGLNIVLIPLFGPVGAALTTLITEFAVTICYATAAFWHLDWRPKGRVLVAAFVATLAGQVGQTVLQSTPAPWWLTTVVVLTMWVGILVLLAPRWASGLLHPSAALRGPAGLTTPLSERERELARMEAETRR